MSEWISVDEQKPPDCESVLLRTVGGHMMSGVWSEEGHAYFDSWSHQPIPYVTAWMPLPDSFFKKVGDDGRAGEASI